MKHKVFTLIVCILVTQLTFAQNISINEGSGFFRVKGNKKHEKDSITVFYHQPKKFTRNSKHLIVLPGAGRNANDYRDSWIEISEKYNVLIIALSYPEKTYDYGNYHLARTVKDLDFSKGVSFKKGTNQVHINEDVIKFNFNENKKDWIFNDFDRIFKLVKKITKSSQKTYDMFGHSAGGQILHRFALLYPNSKADKILASNAGTYTFPDYKTKFPFGLKNTGISTTWIKKSFKKNLILFLGELDNKTETRGRMLRSKTVDKQGVGRIDRGRNFYKFSEIYASKTKANFNWKLVEIPNVGHDYKQMAKAAGEYLYKK
ncbi:hypothetical protein INR76_07930 [Marixanthomonas sp. SCSIO 43207]|uniref:hypothetical protein n=1 Tax=Marixanthomonas sp. SCSIO 43207 TaxID=2779360 RepID=UPI001CA8CCB9|nr:hypothetical protein [Marixanthomonas sp. SCSIO 43207]UAB80065.1 hypothetical protein INR76_07930 [Marixanthomonas sp. SCSIO 43207]